MPRRDTFKVNAQDVQGEPDAEVTFRCITVGERRAYLADADRDDTDMLKAHLVSWVGILDSEGNPLPNPSDKPQVIDALYMHEMRVLARLMWQGPDGADAKN